MDKGSKMLSISILVGGLVLLGFGIAFIAHDLTAVGESSLAAIAGLFFLIVGAILIGIGFYLHIEYLLIAIKLLIAG